MENSIILYCDSHPLRDEIARLKRPKTKVDPMALYELNGSDFEEYDVIIDLTHFESVLKDEYLHKLNYIFEGHILSDLSINWGEYFIEKYPQISMAFNPAIKSPTGMCEVYCQTEQDLKEITTFLRNFNIKPKRVKNPGICFNYPRIVSMIINEAYFSKEEKLATDEDIDTAMKFGVNYPLGPFEWVKLMDPLNVVLILEELFRVTGDPRYRVSRMLKMEV